VPWSSTNRKANISRCSGRRAHLVGFRQIGHLGTLDPLATGVLVLLLGKATRLVHSIMAAASAITPASVRLCKPIPTTPTARRKGPIPRPLWMPPHWSARCRTCRPLRADASVLFRQENPRRPAYELARKKQPVELKPVEVELFEYALQKSPDLSPVLLSNVRRAPTFAHWLMRWRKLGCGAHLAKLPAPR